MHNRTNLRQAVASITLPMLLAAGSGLVRAEPNPGQFLYPDHLARGDSLYATILVSCDSPIPDPAHPATVQRRTAEGTIEWTVDIFLFNDPEGRVCSSAAPPPATFAVLLGPVPPPYHVANVVRRIWLMPEDGDNPTLQSEEFEVRAVQQSPDAKISGVWWTPTVPGELTTITLAGHIGARFGEAFVSTQLFDADGRAVPLTAVGRFDGIDFIADGLRPSRPDPADPAVAVQTAGTVELRYLGCGRAHLAFDSAVPDLSSSARNIELISRAAGLERCEFDPLNLIDTAILFDPAVKP